LTASWQNGVAVLCNSGNQWKPERVVMPSNRVGEFLAERLANSNWPDSCGGINQTEENYESYQL